MPCMFCMAVFALLAGAITATVLDQLEQRLAGVASNGEVQRITDTQSTTVFTFEVPVPAVPGQPAPMTAAAPVAVTVFKAQKRVRIQLRTHAVTAPQAAAIQDLVARASGLVVVSRSSDQTRHIVGEALEELAAEDSAPGSTYGPPTAQGSR